MSYKYKAKDYPLSEQQTVELYRGCFDIDNETIEFETGLNEYKDSDFVLNARNLNRINDDINLMQLAWDTTVLSYLTDKATEFQTLIDRFSHVKTWQSGSSNVYEKNDVVITSPNDGAYYLCLQHCTGANPLPSGSSWQNTYWIKFYIQGNQGDMAWDLNYIGEFNWSATTYSSKDIVYVVRNTEIDFYVCKSAVNYFIQTDPKDDDAHWTLTFSVRRSRFMIVSNLPPTFDFPYNQVFGITDSRVYPNDYLYPSNTLYPESSDIISIVDAQDSTDPSNPIYLDLRTIMQQVVISNMQSNNVIKDIVNEYNL